MAVDELEQVGGDEGEDAGEHLVEGHAEGVEIRAGVDRAVHAPGLLGCHVGQGALEPREPDGFGGLLGEPRGGAEVEQGDAAGGQVDQDVLRFDVLVEHALLMQGAQGLGQGDADGQHGGDVEPARVEQRAQ